jgi:hypothetical protein
LNVKSPISGELKVSLDRPLGSITSGDPNETTVTSLSVPVQANQTTQQKILPVGNVVGPIVIRAIVSGQRMWATGAARTILRRSN